MAVFSRRRTQRQHRLRAQIGELENEYRFNGCDAVDSNLGREPLDASKHVTMMITHLHRARAYSGNAPSQERTSQNTQQARDSHKAAQMNRSIHTMAHARIPGSAKHARRRQRHSNGNEAPYGVTSRVCYDNYVIQIFGKMYQMPHRHGSKAVESSLPRKPDAIQTSSRTVETTWKQLLRYKVSKGTNVIIRRTFHHQTTRLPFYLSYPDTRLA